MLDPKLLRNDLEGVARALARRGFVLDVRTYAALETRRKDIQIQMEQLRNERNARSKEIGKAKAGGRDVTPLMRQVADFGERLKTAEQEFARVQAQLDDIHLGLPNILHVSVPDGMDEGANVEVRRDRKSTRLNSSH